MPIWNKLGPELPAVLSGFHAFTGVDHCGCLSGKGKVTCFKQLMKARVTHALTQLSSICEMQEVPPGLEKFVCSFYGERGTTITDVGK